MTDTAILSQSKEQKFLLSPDVDLFIQSYIQAVKY